MDQALMEYLLRGKQYLDVASIHEIEAFQAFAERTAPRICILCDTMRNRVKLDSYISEYTDIELLTFHCAEQVQEAVESSQCSDAVILVLAPLKIAPQELYEAVKQLSQLDKYFYVLINGWNQLPNTPQSRQEKTQVVFDTYPFAHIVSIQDVCEKPLQDLMSLGEAIQKNIDNIRNSFDTLHTQQTESNYQRLRKKIETVYEKIETEFSEEKHMVETIKSFYYDKEKSTRLSMKAISFSFDDFISPLKQMINSLQPEDIEIELQKQKENAGASQIQDTQEVNLIGQIMKQKISDYLAHNIAPFEKECEARYYGCVSELLRPRDKLKKMRFVSADLVNALLEQVEKENFLAAASRQYDEHLKKILTDLPIKCSLSCRRDTVKRNRMPLAGNNKANLPNILEKDIISKLKDIFEAKYSDNEKIIEYSEKAFPLDEILTETVVEEKVCDVQEYLKDIQQEFSAQLVTIRQQLSKEYEQAVGTELERYFQTIHEAVSQIVLDLKQKEKSLRGNECE